MNINQVALANLLLRISREFSSVQQENFKNNAWRSRFKSQTSEVLSPLISAHGFKISANDGQGQWAEIPWIGIRHQALAVNFQSGTYITYLIHPDNAHISLSLQQGVDQKRKTKNKLKGKLKEELQARARSLNASLLIPDRIGQSEINLHSSGQRGSFYAMAHICGRTYETDCLIDEDLVGDLLDMLEIYTSLADDEMLHRQPIVEVATSASMTEQILETLSSFKTLKALNPTPSLFSNYKRKASLKTSRDEQSPFREALLSIYDPACAACGLSFVISDKSKPKYLLHAAHVIGVDASGVTNVSNGLLLCPNHHWTFDALCWTITDERRIFVADKHRGDALFFELHDKKIPRPISAGHELHTEAIAHHQKRFKAAHYVESELLVSPGAL